MPDKLPLEFMPCPVGNKFRCPTCGGEVFFIALEGEDTPSGPLDNIECIGCHQMCTVAESSKIEWTNRKV